METKPVSDADGEWRPLEMGRISATYPAYWGTPHGSHSHPRQRSETRGLSTGYRKQFPGARDPLQLVIAQVGELDARAHNEVRYRARDEDLARSGQ